MYKNVNTGGLLPKHRYVKSHLAQIVCDFGDVNSLLDIGCGFGYVADLLEGEYPDAKITGIDIDPAAVEFAKNTFENDNVSFTVADCARLPFADGQFDVSLLLFTARFCPTPLTAFREAFRVSSKFVIIGESNVDVLTKDNDLVTYFDNLQHFIHCCPSASFELFSSTYVDPVNFYSLWIHRDLMNAKKQTVLETTKNR